MGVVIKQSFWGTFIAYLGVIIGYINALYLRAEYFDLAQIGVFTLVTANAMIVSPISSFGMGSSYLKFFPSFTQTRRNDFFTFLFLITAVGNILVLTILFSLTDVITQRYLNTAPMYVDYISITGLIIVSNSFFELFFSYSRTILRVIFPSLLRDVYLRAGSLVVVLGYAFGWWDFDASVVGLGLVYFFAFLLLLAQLMLIHGFRFGFHFDFITHEWKKKLFKFGSYSMLLAGSFAMINNITYDQVTTILGADMNGIYTTCFFIALIVEMPRRNMAKVITPILSSEMEQKNMDQVRILYKRSSITMSVIGLLMFIGIVTNLPDLFDFIPKGSAFQAGFGVVVGVCLAKLILMASSFAGEIINFSPLYKYNLIFQILAAIILIGLNYLMISHWGLNGAAWSYLVAITIHVLMKVIFVKYHFGFFPFDKTHLPLLIIGLVVFAGAYFFQPPFQPVINIALRAIVTTLVFIGLIYQFRISTDINKIIHSTFERFLKINLPK